MNRMDASLILPRYLLRGGDHTVQASLVCGRSATGSLGRVPTTLILEGGERVEVSPEWYASNGAGGTGYLVVYEDETMAFVSTEAFLRAYVALE